MDVTGVKVDMVLLDGMMSLLDDVEDVILSIILEEDIILEDIILEEDIILSDGTILMLDGSVDVSPAKAAVRFALANAPEVYVSGTKSIQTELTQCRSPVGAGPSGNT